MIESLITWMRSLVQSGRSWLQVEIWRLKACPWMRTRGEDVMSYKVKNMKKSLENKFKVWVGEHNMTQNEKAKNHRRIKGGVWKWNSVTLLTWCHFCYFNNNFGSIGNSLLISVLCFCYWLSWGRSLTMPMPWRATDSCGINLRLS